MPSESGSAWSPPAGSGERRLSNSSDGSAGSGHSKALSTDSADFLTTRPRTAAVIPGKPATNPLQFVRVGPCDLYRSAQEQLKRAEIVKQSKEVKKEEPEDWQQNLDNWKSSRRKRVEHIIERCVEVKRMENEPSGARPKGKTFNEMLEERVGKRRRVPLALYPEEEATDLSDLGIGTSSTKSSLSEDCDSHSLASDGMDLDKNHSDVDNLSNCGSSNRKLGSSANEYDTCTTTTISSPEPEEYTYEGAIEGYKSRIISQTNANLHHDNKYKSYSNYNKESSPEKTDLNRIRTSVSNKIEEKVSSFQNKTNEIKNNNLTKDLPKVDINKRREQFERESSVESIMNKTKVPEITNKMTIKERLSSLENFTEDANHKSTSDLTKLPTEVVPLKERLSCLEKVKSGSIEDKLKPKVSNGDINSTKSVKERLSCLKQNTLEDEKLDKKDVKEVSVSLKERLSSLDAAKNKEIPKIAVECLNTEYETKDAQEPKELNDDINSRYNGIESQMHSFCHSLDSLDINGTTSPGLERAQSFEDFDCRDTQNIASPSDIETEDSGVHTQGSCAPVDELPETLEEPMEDAAVHIVDVEEPPSLEEIQQPSPEAKAEITIEEVEDNDPKTESDNSIYQQALSLPDDISVTDEITEICMEHDEDTVKSIDQDISVSQNENSGASEENVFEGKMVLHLDLNEICSGAGLTPVTNETNPKPMVHDALDLAFKEIDSEDSMDKSDSKSSVIEKPPIAPKPTSQEQEQNMHQENPMEATDKPKEFVPLYENIDIFYQNGGVLDPVDASAFPLDLPPTALEPPKEKPPPPPVEADEDLGNGSNFKHTSSARRIKKEIHNKRTSFLGIEGQVDNSYLDADLKMAPRPDITSFLQEETKIEKLLYKKTLGQDVDSKLRESRDSGVDMDKGSSLDWCRQSSAENSTSHSRQNSEPYTQMTVTSDEEETARKHRQEQFSAKVSTKLVDLADQPESSVDDGRIEHLDKKLQEQQVTNRDAPDGLCDDATKEVLRFERELLQVEQEELRRQRENLLLKESQTRMRQQTLQELGQGGMATSHRHSMPNLLDPTLEVSAPDTHLQQVYEYEDCGRGPTAPGALGPALRRRPVSELSLKRQAVVSEQHMRQQLAQLSRMQQRRPAAAPPAPPLQHAMRNSRVPSGGEYENVPPVHLRQKAGNGNGNGNGNAPATHYHPMSRHTLQVLSAAPTPKLISNSEWQAARARNPLHAPYAHTQHWLVQEAEQRRIEDQMSKNRMKPVPSQRYSYHYDHSIQNPALKSHYMNTRDPLLNPKNNHLTQETARHHFAHNYAPRDVPNLQQNHVPNLPQNHVPNLPQNHVPNLPQNHVPSLPQNHVPNLQQNHVPNLPQNHVPNLPHNNVTKVPPVVSPTRPVPNTRIAREPRNLPQVPQNLSRDKITQHLPQDQTTHAHLSREQANILVPREQAISHPREQITHNHLPLEQIAHKHLPGGQIAHSHLPANQMANHHLPRDQISHTNLARDQIPHNHLVREGHRLAREPVHRQLAPLEQVARETEYPSKVPEPVLPPAEKNEKILSVSGKRKCSHCGEELGRGAAMIIESLGLCYHVWCFRCAVCGSALGDGRAGADVRVRHQRLHCHACYSSPEGLNYSAV